MRVSLEIRALTPLVRESYPPVPSRAASEPKLSAPIKKCRGELRDENYTAGLRSDGTTCRVLKWYHFKQLCMSMAAWAGAGLEHEEEPMRVKTEMR